ncbi:hypothetical protein EMIT0232MI5_80005 [Pseudomonas sp. IT-232MI5]
MRRGGRGAWGSSSCGHLSISHARRAHGRARRSDTHAGLRVGSGRAARRLVGRYAGG